MFYIDCAGSQTDHEDTLHVDLGYEQAHYFRGYLPFYRINKGHIRKKDNKVEFLAQQVYRNQKQPIDYAINVFLNRILSE